MKGRGMSIHHPNTKEELQQYCLRRLGQPVIQVNVAPEQIEDLTSEAIDYFQLEHYNGSETLYYPVTLTEEMIQNQAIPIDEKEFIGVIALLEASTYSGGDWATIGWQIAAAATTSVFTLSGDGLLTYYQAMSYQNMLKMFIGGKTKGFRYVRHTGKIRLDSDWSKMSAGDVIVAEVVRRIFPEEHPEAYNDPWLKKYLTALIGVQWGLNLIKINGVTMIGGVQINGSEILSQWKQELDTLHQNVLLASQEPLDFYTG